MTQPIRLHDVVTYRADKVLNPDRLAEHGAFSGESPVLVVLAAGKGTRFGTEPKCIQRVHGTPLARYSMNAFQWISHAPAICVVGYRHEDVTNALGADPIYVRSENPTGGTAFAAYEALSVPGLLDRNPPVIISMGDRIVPPGIFRRLWETHRAGDREADLTFLTALYEPPKNRAKGRVVRDDDGRVQRILEEKDILAVEEESSRQALLDITEGNCPLYVVRAATLERYLRSLTNDNAQGQFYITDMMAAIRRDGGEIRTVTTSVAGPEYDLLTSDVTRPMDLALLEGIVGSTKDLLFPAEREVEEAAKAILEGRPAAQVASIARQLRQLM
ncbi:MAG: NTP transferase domain-containing protein, partial [bacterium]|nr:NTP transferase domain-containing protein [bacterium]